MLLKRAAFCKMGLLLQVLYNSKNMVSSIFIGLSLDHRNAMAESLQKLGVNHFDFVYLLQSEWPNVGFSTFGKGDLAIFKEYLRQWNEHVVSKEKERALEKLRKALVKKNEKFKDG